MFRSLRAQLSYSILCIAIVTVGLITLTSNWLINREFDRYVMQSEVERSQSIVEDLGAEFSSFGGWSQDFLHTLGMYSLYDGYILKIYNDKGTTLWDAENHDMSLCEKVMGEISERMELAERSGDFVTEEYTIKSNGTSVGTVSITYYGPFFFSENDYLFIMTLNKILLVIGTLSIFFSVIAASLLARRLARPIVKTAYIASQISEGNYEIRFESKPRTKELDDMVSAINQLVDVLSEKENLRKQLTSDVAHELRTPLTSVATHLEAMMDGIWDATPERLSTCYDEVQRMGVLIADLQQLSNTENQNLQMTCVDTDLLELAKKVSSNFMAQAMQQRIQLSVSGDSVSAQVDPDRFSQVLINLLSNALKYTPEGGRVSVEVQRCGMECCVTISDTGAGIDAKEMPYIFERFYRTDKSRNRKTGGTGIGLTIAKSIVEAHGGRIEVTSIPGEGSRFSVILRHDPLSQDHSLH